MPAPQQLIRSDGGKIVLLVVDGLGGLPHPQHGESELERAQIPNLDALARKSSVGRVQILDEPALTPGSGPGHLSLFGYNPMEIDFGRGVLEALGSEWPLQAGEVAARGNFCTLDDQGIVRDRRAGKPTDDESRALCERLNAELTLSSGSFTLLPGKQHRFTLILQGSGLGHHLNDNDPQVTGKAPLPIEGSDPASKKSAALVGEFLEKARDLLRQQPKISGMLLRGFSSLPDLESFQQRHRLRAAAIAIYPMYRGVARLVGMDILSPGTSLAQQIEVARTHWRAYDFFFLHFKDADAAGHSGDFAKKIVALEEVDRHIPALLDLGAEVTMITGDHSTPCICSEHSWHPVPTILHSQRSIPIEDVVFSERGVLRGDLGTLKGRELVPLALAHSGRLDKFGA